MSNHKEEDMFYTRCHVQSKVCSLKIDNGAKTNMVSEYMVKKLGLTVKKHPWFDEDCKLIVSRQVTISIAIGKYEDEILCDVQPMENCHILLGEPWQNERRAIYDGHKNRYSFKYKGGKINLVPMSSHEIRQDQLILKQRQTKFSSTLALDQAVQPHSASDSATPLDQVHRVKLQISPNFLTRSLHSSSPIESNLPDHARPLLDLLTIPNQPNQAPTNQVPFPDSTIFTRMVEKVDFVFGDFAFPKTENKVKSLLDEVMKPKIEKQMVYQIYKGYSDLRTNLFQVGEDDVILTSIKKQLEAECVAELAPTDEHEDEEIFLVPIDLIISTRAKKNWTSSTTTFDPGPAHFSSSISCPRPILQHPFRG